VKLQRSIGNIIVTEGRIKEGLQYKKNNPATNNPQLAKRNVRQKPLWKESERQKREEPNRRAFSARTPRYRVTRAIFAFEYSCKSLASCRSSIHSSRALCIHNIIRHILKR
jgi:hypothetical protein